MAQISKKDFDKLFNEIQDELTEKIRTNLKESFKPNFERNLRRAYARRNLTKDKLYNDLRSGVVNVENKDNPQYKMLLDIHGFFLDIAPIRFRSYRPSSEMVESFERYVRKKGVSSFAAPTYTLKSGKKKERKFKTEDAKITFIANERATSFLKRKQSGERGSGKGFLSHKFNENSKYVNDFVDDTLESLAIQVLKAMKLLE